MTARRLLEQQRIPSWLLTIHEYILLQIAHRTTDYMNMYMITNSKHTHTHTHIYDYKQQTHTHTHIYIYIFIYEYI